MVTAVLRIGEMEDGRRRGAFTRVDLGEVAAVAVESTRRSPRRRTSTSRLRRRTGRTPSTATRDLCFEALSNLLDNALKFTPPAAASRWDIAADRGRDRRDRRRYPPGAATGGAQPGFHRFYRAEAARQTPGHGLA